MARTPMAQPRTLARHYFMSTPSVRQQEAPGHWRRYRVLYLLLAVCIAPVVASYLAYYVLRPSGSTNYGDLIQPQRQVAGLTATTLDAKPASLSTLRGSWVMFQTAGAVCDESCRKHLWLMRQVRATTGKDRDRVERVWLVTDAGTLDPALMQQFAGTIAWRAGAADLVALLPTGSGSIDHHIWLIDPLGNLMLRWPRDADPNRMKKDLARVLRASRVG